MVTNSITERRRFAASALVQDWCSRANCKQRAGRAGRTAPGVICRLFSESPTFEQNMAENPTPELRRVPLDNLCLELKAMYHKQRNDESVVVAGSPPSTNRLRSGSCSAFLSSAPEPPPADAIEGALVTLLDAGALELIETDGNNVLLPPSDASDPYVLLRSLPLLHPLSEINRQLL